MKLLNILWERWKKVSLKLVNFQAQVILSLIYWLVVTPIAIVYRLVADPFDSFQSLRASRLKVKSRQKTNWIDKDSRSSADLTGLSRQA
ncbi:hypothetical protein A2783_02125 [Microgenomates group bacterium RIFCSPHIGHO2_01_FULL_45_11]|nr:MAG: hypothetical protein A2783_02125 [Microgenomates group bacterium RIFCSPHIGHO2_01_FULL_45_11]